MSSALWARLLPGIRTFISLPAGIAEVPLSDSVPYTAAGCLPWTAGLAAAGYAVGATWQTLADAMRGPLLVVAIACLGGGAALAHRAVRRLRMTRTSDESTSNPDSSDFAVSER